MPCKCLGFVVVAFLVFGIPVAVAHPYPSSLAPTWLSLSPTSPSFAYHTHTHAPRNHRIIPTLPSFVSLRFCVKCLPTQNHRTTTTFGQTRQAVHEASGYISAYIWLYALAPFLYEAILLVGNSVSLGLKKGQYIWGVLGIVFTSGMIPLAVALHIVFRQELIYAPLAHLNFVAMYVFLGAVMTLSILNVRSHIKRYGVAVLPWVNMGARGDLQTGLSFSTTF